MGNWIYEILDDMNEEVVEEDEGFDSESEAEIFAHSTIKYLNLNNCHVRTLEKKEIKL